MIARRVVQQILLVSALAAGIAACSSSGNSSSSGASSSPSSAPSSSAAAPSSAPASSSGTASTIAANWAAFFNAKTPVAKRISLLQDGQTFASVIRAQAGSGLAASATAKVTKVTIVSPTQAKVTYSILVGGQSALSGQSGVAVSRQDLEGRAGQLLRPADPGKRRQDVGAPGRVQVSGLVAWSAR